MNKLRETLVRHKRIIPVLIAIVAIASYMIPAHLASAAVSGSGNVQSIIAQSNSISASNSGKYGGAFADLNTLTNAATNAATVQISSHGGGAVGGSGTGGGGVSNSGNVLQAIGQSNSVTATNTADFGTASASLNSLSNTASNSATVNIHNHGGGYKYSGVGSKGVSNSGNVVQAIDQSNSVSATNSGASGTASADLNSLSNTATNTANVNIHNHGSSNHGSSNGGGGKGVSDSGNVVQAIHQSNSVSASNSGTSGTASASGNSLSNSASNSATVHISNSNHNSAKKH